jgi:hypothetical protein
MDSFSPGEVKTGTKTREYRGVWKKLINDNSRSMATKLRQRHKEIYTYLSLYDSEWLNQHRPVWRENAISSRRYPNPQELDKQVAKEICDGFRELTEGTDQPIWITETRILNWMGLKGLYYYHRNKLPKATKILDQVTETREEYLIRCIWWAANGFLHEGTIPTKENLKTRSGSSSSTFYDAPEVIDAMNAAMEMLQRSLEGSEPTDSNDSTEV